MIDQARIEELKRLSTRAVSGQWVTKIWEDDEDTDWKSVTVHDDKARDVIIGGVITDDHDEIAAFTANAEFIAAAREAVPELIAEVERLQAQLANATRFDVQREEGMLPVTIERYRQRDRCSFKWAICCGDPHAVEFMNRDGKWEYRPFDPEPHEFEAFLSRCRYDSYEEALQTFRKFDKGARCTHLPSNTPGPGRLRRA